MAKSYYTYFGFSYQNVKSRFFQARSYILFTFLTILLSVTFSTLYIKITNPHGKLQELTKTYEDAKIENKLKIEEFEELLNRTKASKQEFEKNLTHVTIELQSLHNETKNLQVLLYDVENEKDQAVQTLHDHLALIEHLKNTTNIQLSELIKQNEIFKKDHSRLQEENSEQSATIDELELQLNLTQEEHQIYVDYYNEATKEIARLNATILEQREKVQNLTRDFANSTIKLDKCQANLTAVIQKSELDSTYKTYTPTELKNTIVSSQLRADNVMTKNAVSFVYEALHLYTSDDKKSRNHTAICNEVLNRFSGTYNSYYYWGCVMGTYSYNFEWSPSYRILFNLDKGEKLIIFTRTS